MRGNQTPLAGSRLRPFSIGCSISTLISVRLSMRRLLILMPDMSTASTAALRDPDPFFDHQQLVVLAGDDHDMAAFRQFNARA